MKTYSVKQIADLLDTNPETVRRWIRADKLKAVQVSRKNGNVIAEDELQRFLRDSPRYLSKFTSGIAPLSPIIGITSIAGEVIARAIMAYIDEKNTDIRIMPDDFKKYLNKNICMLKKTVTQKEDLIRQTEDEILELERRIEQYQYLLNHGDILDDALATVTAPKADRKE